MTWIDNWPWNLISTKSESTSRPWIIRFIRWNFTLVHHCKQIGHQSHLYDYISVRGILPELQWGLSNFQQRPVFGSGRVDNRNNGMYFRAASLPRHFWRKSIKGWLFFHVWPHSFTVSPPSSLTFHWTWVDYQIWKETGRAPPPRLFILTVKTGVESHTHSKTYFLKLGDCSTKHEKMMDDDVAALVVDNGSGKFREEKRKIRDCKRNLAQMSHQRIVCMVKGWNGFLLISHGDKVMTGSF